MIGSIWDSHVSFFIYLFWELLVTSFFCLVHIALLLLLNGTSCIMYKLLTSFVILITCKNQVNSDLEKEETSVEKMGRQKQTRRSKSTSLSADALPKKQMTKDEKVRATEEKKLRKEVSFFLHDFSGLCSLDQYLI